MARTVARTEIEIIGDGSTFPRTVRRVARQGGEAGAEEFDESFNKGLKGAFDKALKETEARFSSDRWAKTFAKAGETASASFGDRFRDRLKRINGELRNMRKNLLPSISLWQRLSHNTRQWTLIIGAVIAGMSDLATLSSALGVGLLSVASAFGSLVVGGGVFVSTILRFAGDIEKLPPELRAARKEFDALGKTLSDMNKNLSVRVFRNTERAWRSLGETVKGLEPAFGAVADAVHGLIVDLADNLAPGTKNFQNLSRFIEQSAPVFDRLVRAAGTFGSALLAAFSSPALEHAVLGLVGWIEDLANGFDDFVNGPNFDDWVANGEAVLEAFGRLLEGVGDALNNLVDDKAVAQTISFLDNLTRFLAGGGEGLLEFFKNLDIFGLIAEALADIGDALAPLEGPLNDFADGLNKITQIAIDAFAEDIERVAEALAPFVQTIADFMDENPDLIAESVVKIAEAFLLFKGGAIITGITTALIGFTSEANAKKFGKSLRGFFAVAITTALLEIEDDPSIEQSFMNIFLGIFGGGVLGNMIGGPVGAAIGAFAGGLAAFVMTSLQDAFNGETFALGDSFQDTAVGKWLHDGVQGWGDMLVDWRDNTFIPWWNGMLESNGTAFEEMGDQINTGLDTIGTYFEDTFNEIATNIENWWTDVTTGWTNFWGEVGNNIRTGLNNINTFFVVLFASIKVGWDTFWNGLSGIVKSVWTTIENTVRNAVNNVIRWVNSMIDKINRGLDTLNSLSGGFLNFQIPGIPELASGGILTGPRRILAGEDGPEAIVPLRRSLSRVNPEVRVLSAIAQGKSPAMAGGGTVGSGRVVNIEQGAVQVIGSQDPERTSLFVLNRLAERIAG